MKLSAKTEYACIAILELARRFETGEPVRIREIADEHGIPARFLVQILLQLKGAGYVASTRGALGGYQLLKPPAKIPLADRRRALAHLARHYRPRTRNAQLDHVRRFGRKGEGDCGANVLHLEFYLREFVRPCAFSPSSQCHSASAIGNLTSCHGWRNVDKWCSERRNCRPIVRCFVRNFEGVFGFTIKLSRNSP
jgi:Rrf2 family protein